MKLHACSGRLLLAISIFVTMSCQKEVSDNSTDPQITSDAKAVSATDQLIKSLGQATSRFNSTTQAIKAGYEPDDHCVSHPQLGGMGYHWANMELVDPVFNPMEPEVLLYAKGPGGNLKLVAVEYIVINTGQARPSFGDHLFDIGGTPVPVPHWSLHVWVHENNPNGIFTPFNPNISCQ